MRPGINMQAVPPREKPVYQEMRRAMRAFALTVMNRLPDRAEIERFEDQASSTSDTSYCAARRASISRSRCGRSRVSHSISVMRPLAGSVVKTRW